MWHFHLSAINHYRGFNPHTHAGCDVLYLHQTFEKFEFQSTHPRRVWQGDVSITRVFVQFQSTHPRRVWLLATVHVLQLLLFQSTHPRRVWQLKSERIVIHTKFQSTHPRRVWLLIDRFDGRFLLVSIHTPTQGVTKFTLLSLCGYDSFNPHTHAGCDSISNNIL